MGRSAGQDALSEDHRRDVLDLKAELFVVHLEDARQHPVSAEG